MSEEKEVSLFEKGVQLPAHMRTGERDELTRSLLGAGSGGGGKRISIRGSVWRMMVDGEQIAVNEDKAMSLVIVRVSQHTHRTYYAGEYNADVFTPPACWSEDGKVPHSTIGQPQSNRCSTCPQNVKGSGNGKSRACQYSRVAAVLLDGDLDGDIYTLKLPAMSIFGDPKAETNMSLEAYTRFLDKFKASMISVVTEAKFDINSSTPKITFKPLRPLSDEEWETATRRGESDESKECVAIPAYASMGGYAGGPAPAPVPASIPAPAPAPVPRGPKIADNKARPDGKIAAKEANVADILDGWDD
jgi:hypothetical protein